MANFTTYFLPKDSAFSPSDAAANYAVALLEGAFPDYPISMRRYPVAAFITSGSEFDKFTCPSCHKLVKLYDLSDDQKHWWYTVLWDLRSQSQVVTVPCCGAELAVGAFNFGGDAAFASFELSVEGAGEDEAIGGDDLTALESTLGCEIRQIILVDG